MKTPVQITYRHMDPSDGLTALINEQVAKLEEFADDIGDCRVVVDEPNQHHREKHFRVEIIVQVSGAELVAGRDQTTVRGADAYAGVLDTFRTMRRQLQEHAQRRRHEVKAHSEPGPR